ncbi:MAG TPA: universal stress protein [Methanoregulaceae archaeon]|nr:universal stress protein [Methanoregulaceae archaeon]HOV67435.1 universal stress protein [Methanoregulaceae archaeon]HQJ87168.1 universal stress protein [Methanoregulaceae archaeon]
MFRKVLVAIDGSNQSRLALSTAVDVAKVWKAEVHAAYVIEIGLFSSLPVDNTWEVMYSLLDKEGKEILEEAVAAGREAGIPVTTHLRQGHAGEELLNLAREIGADLIVLGSLGKSGIERLLIGSVSSFVVTNSPVTTMVVRQ